MPTHTFSKRSLENLDVHPDLKRVAFRALELLGMGPVDFIVTDGGRTVEEQKAFVASGASQTMNSRHLGGYALDYVAIAPDVSGKMRVTYDAVPMMTVALAFLLAGTELLGKDHVEWGGVWETLVDTPHIQLSRKYYPG